MKDALKDAKKLKAAYEEVKHAPDHLRTRQSHEVARSGVTSWLVCPCTMVTLEHVNSPSPRACCC